MATPYNQFGTTYASVVSLYPGTVLADYPDQPAVDAALNRSVREVASSLNQNSFRNLTEPDLELVERRASAGQTTVTLGLNAVTANSWPLVANKTHIWVGPPQAFAARPVLATDPFAQPFGSGYQTAGYSLMGPLVELASSQFSVAVATGVITLTTALTVYQLVYASYTVDVNVAAYSVPSLAEIAVLGAGAELGARLYTSATQEWALVVDYKTRYTAWLDRMVKGEWVPDELRFMRWWKEVERVDVAAPSSVRMYRG